MRSFIEEIQAIVGPAGLITLPQEVAPYASDWRKRYLGRPAAVVKPASTAEVAEVVRACAESRTAVVPQGGNTGLCGAATPDASGTQIVLNLSRMNRVHAIDTRNNTMTVEAGCVLANLQNTAEEASRLFPLSLAAEGSCEIGGNLSTNAGGTAVLRYGNARELVLGLEVVLPSGEVWDGLRALRKDNTGYDLKQLFIGSEGTLGIITAAVLKLFPQPRSTSTALIATTSPEAAVQLLAFLKTRLGHDVTAFELISAPAMTLVREYLHDDQPLFERPHDWMVLIEAISHAEQSEADDLFNDTLTQAYDLGLVKDALLGTTEAHVRRFWQLREEISDAQTRVGGSVRCDISVPLSAIAEFIDEATAQVLALDPAIRM